MNHMRRPILFLIDVEPDGRRQLDRDNGWTGTRNAIPEIQRLRESLENATRSQVKFCWFLRADPQIKATWGSAAYFADACPAILREIESHDDFAGIHVHLWRYSNERQTWYCDFTARDWIDECTSTTIEAISSMLGYRLTANRFGDRWLSNDAIDVLRKHGIRYDLTLEPGLPDQPVHDDPNATAWLPDFRAASRTPYVPSASDYLVPSSAIPENLWMIPLTTSRVALRLVRRPPFVVRGSRSPNLVLDHRSVWGNLRHSLDHPDSTPIVIVFRSGDLANARFRRNFHRTVDNLLRHPALEFCDVTTPDEALARWRSRE